MKLKNKYMQIYLVIQLLKFNIIYRYVNNSTDMIPDACTVVRTICIMRDNSKF